MPDDDKGQGQPGNNPAGGQQEGGTGGQSNGAFDLSKLPPDAQEYVRTLQTQLNDVNSESKARRLKIYEMEKRLRAIEQGNQQQLAEQGNYKAIADQHAAKIAELEPYKTRAESLEILFRESNDRRVKALPEDKRGLVPLDYPPEKLSTWLDMNFEHLIKKPAPSTDAGAGGSGSGQTKVELTPEQKVMAKRFNMTDEQYAKSNMGVEVANSQATKGNSA